MTRTRLTIVALAALALFGAGRALATPPDRIRLSFDDSTHTLSIAVHHPTFYIAAHHVGRIIIMLNDSLVVQQLFNGQTNTQEQDTQCTIPGAGPGDRLTVTAFCNLFGKRTESLLLPARSP